MSIKSTTSFFNVFLSSNETNKLFGSKDTFYYIKDGVIVHHFNEGLTKSLNYSYFTFNWSQKYTNENILYQIIVEPNTKIKNKKLYFLSIPKFGILLDNIPSFTIFVNCSGIIEILKLTINMIFLVQAKQKQVNPLKLKVFRYVNCSDTHLENFQHSGTYMTDAYNTPTSFGIVLCAVILGITMTSLLTVIVKRFLKSHDINLLGLCCESERIILKKPFLAVSHHQSSKHECNISFNKYAIKPMTEENIIEENETKERENDNESFFTSSSVDTHQTGATPIVKRRFNDPLQILNEIQIPRNRITLKNLLLEGTFCQMYEGVMSPQNRRYGGVNKKVMIKTIADFSTLSQANVLIKDGTLLAGLKQRNLIPVIGACTASFQGIEIIQPPWLIYRYTEPGNLKLVLRQNAFQEDDVAVTFSTPHLIVIAIQLLRALKYLHDRNIIHKDVATRNCFLNGRNQALLCDSALSRDLFPEDYQCLGDNENRPVKWLSVEALIQRRFSHSSDIWAFGILLWELVNKADDPYSEVDPFEMPTFLRSGYRLRQPKNCPDNLWTIMNACWAAEVNKRPLLTEVMKKLKSFQEILTGFV